jgi:uncharacterized membrane protein
MSDRIVIGDPDGTMGQPGTSAILVIRPQGRPARVPEALRPYGGTVPQTSLSPDARQQPMKTLHGDDPGARSGSGPRRRPEARASYHRGARR